MNAPGHVASPPTAASAAASGNARATAPAGWWRRLDRRLLAVVLLLPVLVFAWLPLLQKAPPGPPSELVPAAPNATTPTPAPAAAPLAEAMPLTAPMAGSATAIADLGNRIRTACAPFEPRWHAPDPAPPAAPMETPAAGEQLHTLPDQAAVPPPPELTPTAILLAPGSAAIALVRGLPRSVGDTVDGYVVRAIGEGRIEYTRDGSTHLVTMPAPGLGGSR